MKKISYSLVFNRKKKLNKKGMAFNQGIPQTRPVGRKT